MIVDLNSIKNKTDFWDWVDIRKAYDNGLYDEAITRAINKMMPYIKQRKFVVENKVKNTDDADDFEQMCFIGIMSSFNGWKPFKYILFDNTIVYDNNLHQMDEAREVQGRLGYSYFKTVINRKEVDLYRELNSRHDVLSANGEIVEIDNAYKINGKNIAKINETHFEDNLIKKDLIDKWNELTEVLEDEKKRKGIKRANYDKRRRKMKKFIAQKNITYNDIAVN